MSVIKEKGTEAKKHIITEPLTLINLPTELLEIILKNLSFENVANLRQVCQRFNSTCATILNGEFKCLRALLQNKFHRVKVLMPRRESLRRKHPMARESDIIETLHMRLSLLHMAFGKHIEKQHCCFFPGEILDEVHRIIKYVDKSTNLSRAYKVTDELIDLSMMAMEYFKEHIEPSLPEITYFTADFLNYLPSISSSPSPQVSFFEEFASSINCTGIINPELIVESSDPSSISPAVNRNIRKLREFFKRNNNQIQSIKLSQQLSSKKNASTQKEIYQLKLQLKEYEKKFNNASRKLDCTLNELNRCKTELEFLHSKPSCSQYCKNYSWKKLQIHILKDDISDNQATKGHKRKLEKLSNIDLVETNCKRLYYSSPKKAASHNKEKYVNKCKKVSISCQKPSVSKKISKKAKINKSKKSIVACSIKSVTRITRNSFKKEQHENSFSSNYDSTWSSSNSLPEFPPYLIIIPLQNSFNISNVKSNNCESQSLKEFSHEIAVSTSIVEKNLENACMVLESESDKSIETLQELEVFSNPASPLEVLLEPSCNILCPLEATSEPSNNRLHSLEESPEAEPIPLYSFQTKPVQELETNGNNLLGFEAHKSQELQDMESLPKPVDDILCPLEASSKPRMLLVASTERSVLQEGEVSPKVNASYRANSLTQQKPSLKLPLSLKHCLSEKPSISIPSQNPTLSERDIEYHQSLPLPISCIPLSKPLHYSKYPYMFISLKQDNKAHTSTTDVTLSPDSHTPYLTLSACKPVFNLNCCPPDNELYLLNTQQQFKSKKQNESAKKTYLKKNLLKHRVSHKISRSNMYNSSLEQNSKQRKEYTKASRKIDTSNMYNSSLEQNFKQRKERTKDSCKINTPNVYNSSLEQNSKQRKEHAKASRKINTSDMYNSSLEQNSKQRKNRQRVPVR